jgi:hypothetical protein
MFRSYGHLQAEIYIYIYIYIFVCVCVCVCVQWKLTQLTMDPLFFRIFVIFAEAVYVGSFHCIHEWAFLFGM